MRYPTLSGTVPDLNMRQGILPIDICLSANVPTSTSATCTDVLPAGTPFASRATINPVAQQYLQATTNDPSFSAFKFYGYINAKLFADALNKAGQNLTRDSLRNALDHDFVNYDTGFGPTLSWSPTQHSGVSDFIFFQVKNGQLAPASDFIKASSVWS